MGWTPIRVKESRKSCAARSWDEGRYVASKTRRAVSEKIVIEASERCYVAAMRKRVKTVG